MFNPNTYRRKGLTMDILNTFILNCNRQIKIGAIYHLLLNKLSSVWKTVLDLFIFLSWWLNPFMALVVLSQNRHSTTYTGKKPTNIFQNPHNYKYSMKNVGIVFIADIMLPIFLSFRFFSLSFHLDLSTPVLTLMYPGLQRHKPKSSQDVSRVTKT